VTFSPRPPRRPESNTNPSRRQWHFPRLAILTAGVLALVLLGAALSAASILDLFKAAQQKTQAQQDELNRAYSEAAILMTQGKSLAALEKLKRCVELDPQSEFLRVHLADAYLDLNDPAGAERAIAPLASRENPGGEILRIQARIALQRNEYSQSIALYEKAVADQPKNVQALQALAVLYYEHARDLEKTKDVCKQILELDGRNLSALLYYAESSALTGDVELAADLWDRMLRYRPQLVDRLDDLAQRLVKRGEKEKALYLYRKGVLMLPSAELLQRGFETLAGEGDTTATLEAYRSLTEEAPRNIDIRKLYAERLMQVRHWDDAAEQYQRILDLQPNNVAAHTALAEIALQKGNVEEALHRFEEALNRHPTDPDVYATVARLYLMRDDIEKSEQLLNRALALGANNPTVLVLLADVLERKGELDQAERRLKEALDALPANPTLLTLLAGFYSRHNREADAADVMEQMLAVRPRDLNLYAELLRYYLRENREKSADLLIERGRKTFEDDAEFNILVGQVSAQQDTPKRAEEALKRAVTAEPANIDARVLLASLYLSLARGDDAIQTLTALERISLDADQQYAWRLALGGVYMQLRRWDDAVEQFRKAYDLNPHEFGLYPGLIEALIKAGKTSEAVETLNNAVREFMVAKPREVQLLRAQTLILQKEYQRARSVLTTLSEDHPEDPDIYFSLGMLGGEMDDMEAAETAYRKVMDLDPDNATAYNNLGYLFAQKGQRLDEAEQLVRKALELQPGAGFILDSLGWVYYQKGDLEEALKYLQEAKSRSVADPEIFEHLGDVYRKQGKTEAALHSYEEAVKMAPDRPGIRVKMEEITNPAP